MSDTPNIGTTHIGFTPEGAGRYRRYGLRRHLELDGPPDFVGSLTGAKYQITERLSLIKGGSDYDRARELTERYANRNGFEWAGVLSAPDNATHQATISVDVADPDPPLFPDLEMLNDQLRDVEWKVHKCWAHIRSLGPDTITADLFEIADLANETYEQLDYFESWLEDEIDQEAFYKILNKLTQAKEGIGLIPDNIRNWAYDDTDPPGELAALGFRLGLRFYDPVDGEGLRNVLVHLRSIARDRD